MLYVSDGGGGVGDFRSTVRSVAGAVGREAKQAAKKTGRALVKSAGNELGSALRRLTGGAGPAAPAAAPESSSALPWLIGGLVVAAGAYAFTRKR